LKKYSYIGTAQNRIDAAGKVTGETKFLADLPVREAVFAAPVYASVPYGRVLSVDLTKARKYTGYLDFISAEDIPGVNEVGVILQDQPLFARPVVRYVGDTIGLIIADTATAALNCARQVKIDCEPYRPVFTIEDSKQMTEGFLHDSNLACEHRVEKGDIARGFELADHIIEASFSTPAQEHYYLEPQGCIAVPEPGGKISIIASLQCPFYVQKAVGRVLGIPYAHVRVEQAPTGGAFGGKEDVPSEVCARAAVAARKIGKPVQLIYTRNDDIQLTSKRHPFTMQYKVGVTKAGKLVAAQILLEQNSGAYATLSSVVSYRASVQAMGPYVVPNVSILSRSYYTNLPPNGAFRGFGSPQATFGHERMMDIIARRLQMDPVELRLKNIIRENEETVTGQKISHGAGAAETLKRARDAAGWNSSGTSRLSSDRYVTALGVATCHYGNCLGAAGWSLDGSAVHLSLLRDGSITVAFGLVEMGQGALTAVAQMTAEALAVDIARITVLPTSTDQVPDSGPSVASRNIVMTGQAILNAAQKLRPILRTAAARLLDCEESEVSFAGDRASNTLTGAHIGFTELADFLYLNNYPMSTTGWWHVPSLKFDAAKGAGEAYFTYSYATHVAKVRVDKLTGLVKVEKFWAAHDVGRAVNPAGIEGQVEGGVTQGIGWALTEQLVFDEGRVISPNLSTYLLPTAADSAEVDTAILEFPEPEGPWGARGIGEPAIIPVAAAIANAVSRAVGKQFYQLPLTPESVLSALSSISG